MSSDGVPFLLITANVGSIFEEPNVMLKIWTEEFLSTISRLDPKFIALHCQEVGGKNYADSMRHVEDFLSLLISSEELRLFDKVRIFLDEDFSSAEHFTALGNLYFVHETLKDVLLWDFKESTFVPVSGQEIHSGNIENVTTKEKAKFPQDFFPECKWSRKGFLRTRWNVKGTVFDLINIHLFHDASNFIAMETFPSVYSKTRRRALEHTLDRFHNDQFPNVPYFVFGDFNFRTDTAGVIKKLTSDTRESKQSNKGNLSRLQFRNESDDLILTLGKKEFSYHEHQQVFVENSGEWLREFDKELGDFEGRLFEFPIRFVPSYPFQENVKEGTIYMQTRVPAWCDRVLLSPSAKSLVKNISSPSAIEYGIIGHLTCMGDHKPVYLRVMLASDAGMINCCSSLNSNQLCFRVSESYLTSNPLLSSSSSILPDCRSAHSAAAASTVDRLSPSNFLHAAPYKHDPYTPDSMDSSSPNTINVTSENIGCSIAVDSQQAEQRQQWHKHFDRAVSPGLLKSKLELIVERRKSESASLSNSNSDGEDNAGNKQDAGQWSMRKSRSSSDVSWQRSHLLTRAWVNGKIHQAYRSFASSLHCTDDINGRSGNQQQQQQNLQQQWLQCLATGVVVIPRISIINASNFQSNASSVHLPETEAGTPQKNKSVVLSDLHSSDQCLDCFNDYSKTSSLSQASSSQDRSPVNLTIAEDELYQELQENPDVNENQEVAKDIELISDLAKKVESRDIEKQSQAIMINKSATVARANEVSQGTLETMKEVTRSNSILSQELNANKHDKKNNCCKKCCIVS